jgi:uncharacterized repeat protein (TIGR01451 family)
MSPTAQAAGGGSAGGAPIGGGSSGSGVDLAVSVLGPDNSPVRGATFPISLEVTNVGTETATDVSVNTYLSEALALDNYTAANPAVTCEVDEWGGLVCSLPSLASGASARIQLTLTRVMARETWLDTWAASSTDEGNYENNYGGIYLEPDRSNPADVEVTVSAPEQPEPGSEFDYTAVVTNRGPELARAVTFNQSISDAASYVSVTSSDPSDECTLFEESYDGEGIEGGAYTYREVRCTLGNMRFAEQTTITVTVVRDDPHELWSSAWVGTSSYDENYDNDYADASTAGHPSVTSDLGMTITGPDATPLVGDDATYTLTVTNTGPAPAGDVVADTWLPQELALRGITPSRGTDVCTQDQYQGISCTFGNLAVGETATVAIDVTRVRAREYWMGGSIWSTNYDPNYDNNYAEQEVGADKSVLADIGVKLNGPKDPPVGENFDYTATVTNHGPDAATLVSLVASVPDGTEFVSATSPDDSDVCTLFEETYEDEGKKTADGSFAPYTYQEVRCELGTLVPAETGYVTITLNRTADYEIWESAWASTASYDENYDNDYDSSGSFGEPVPGCGAPIDDTGAVTDCYAKGGAASADRTYVASSAPGKRVMKTGKGNDKITVRVPTHSKKHRRIVVNAGRGRDVIKLLVAPGAGNVTVILKGGAGRDSIEVLAPKPGRGFKLRMIGGSGTDSCASAMGDRHRSRAC